MSSTKPHDLGDKLARYTFLTVLVLGGLAVALLRAEPPASPADPDSTTSTTVSQNAGADDGDDADDDGDGRNSVLEELFNPGIRLVLQAAIVLAVAFVTGAAVQRAWLANFEVKVGNLEIPALAKRSSELAETVAKNVEYVEDNRDRMRRLDDRVDEVLERVRVIETHVQRLVIKQGEIVEAVNGLLDEDSGPPER